jgi:nucleoside-diphosphate-sugar epimerase
MRSSFRDPLNLGQDRLISINRLAEMIADIAGITVTTKHVPGPQGVRGRNSDNRLLNAVLEWSPQVSLEDGLTETYHWIEQQVRVNSAAQMAA